jgi:glutamine synthetase
MIQKFYLNQEKILKNSQEFFSNSNSHTIKIGCELEFFLFEENSQKPAALDVVDDFILQLKEFYNVEKERGISQIEIKTDFTSDLFLLCNELENCKKHLRELAKNKNLEASFLAQPFLDDCGSALQFNISLHDESGKNLFLTDEKLLKNCAASLLLATNSMMIFLAPEEKDYQRFDFELNKKLFQNGKFPAPINLSFGADNRTCAIRIPAGKNKRLEYRLAAAGANPWLCISAILFALAQNHDANFEQIFGNAFDSQYDLKNFCKNLKEAEEIFFMSENFLRKKLENGL